MIGEHVEAFVALIEAGGNVEVYHSRAPAGAELPYVVVHPDQSIASPTGFADVSDWRVWTPQTTCVGATGEQVAALADRVDARLLDRVPQVASRSCTPVRKSVSLPVARDEDVKPPVFIARDVWTFSSIPA